MKTKLSTYQVRSHDAQGRLREYAYKAADADAARERLAIEHPELRILTVAPMRPPSGMTYETFEAMMTLLDRKLANPPKLPQRAR